MSSKVKLVTDYIFSRISDGSWQLGSKISSENELCHLLDVSRTTVRAAIQQYMQIGILESIHGKGTYLCSNDLTLLGSGEHALKTLSYLEEFQLVHQARQVVEPEILAYAAKHATPELITKLEMCCDKMMMCLGNQEEFIKADMEFHKELADFMKNKYVSAFYEKLLDRDDINHLSNDMFGYYDGVQTHLAFLEAIKEHNLDKIRHLATSHHEERLKVVHDIAEKAAENIKELQVNLPMG